MTPSTPSPAHPVLIENDSDFCEAASHCLMSSEMDLRHQGMALRDFALPALEYARFKLLCAAAKPMNIPGTTISFPKKLVDDRYAPTAAHPPEGPPIDALELLPPAYMLAKLAMVMPLFQEARDALPAINEMQRKLNGISPTLADRMDIAGTYSIDDWEAANPTTAASGLSPASPEQDHPKPSAAAAWEAQAELPKLPEPAAEARWWEQNAFNATELSLLREHPGVEKYWGDRDKLKLYTADQMQEYARAALSASPTQAPKT